jgi:hypothetical protein
MLRLAHRILSSGTVEICQNGGMKLRDASALIRASVTRLREGCEIIIADNVFEYLADLAGGGELHYTAKDFPCIMPPFPMTWIEFRSETPYARFDEVLSLHEMGCLVSFHEGAKDIPAEWRENHPEIAHELQLSLWSVMKGKPMFLCTLHSMPIDKHGMPVMDFVPMCGPFGDPAMAKSMVVPIMMTLQFLNFRNVVQVDVTETEGPPAKWLRRMKQPELTYRMVQINPMKDMLRREGNVATEGLSRALHKVRGHMVTYTEERPLFGKYPGTFWVPAHERGDSKNGVVAKDYRVSPLLAGVPFPKANQKT